MASQSRSRRRTRPGTDSISSSTASDTSLRSPDSRRAYVCRERLIGAHSFSHESMGYESDSFFRADLMQCRNFFEQQLRLPLDAYAFPNGSYRPEQIQALFH